MIAPNAYLSHELPQRLRLYIPSKKNVPRYFSEIKNKLSEKHTIDGIKVNAKTGSVLIFHQSSIDDIANFAGKHHLFIIRKKQTGTIKPLSSPSRKLARKFAQIDFEINRESRGSLDLTTLTVGGLMSLTIFQILKGKILPPAWTLFSQAINAVRIRHFTSISRF